MTNQNAVSSHVTVIITSYWPVLDGVEDGGEAAAERGDGGGAAGRDQPRRSEEARHLHPHPEDRAAGRVLTQGSYFRLVIFRDNSLKINNVLMCKKAIM